jgi:polyphosphate kinase
MTTTEAAAPPLKLLDRDLAWLEFNHRVLHEAVDERTPLLERVKFLAIFSSNLDEFFMKRGERFMQRPGAPAPANGAESPSERIRQAVLSLLAIQAETYTQTIRPALAQHGIHLLSWSELDEEQKQAAIRFYHRNVFPILTPLKLDPAHPFPFISNLSTSLGVFQRAPQATEVRFARVKVPGSLPQWVALPQPHPDGRPGQSFVKLLDIIAHTMVELFPGMVILEIMPFRLTRNADIDLDDEPGEDLVELVEEGLRQRRLEDAVRLEYGLPASQPMVNLLLNRLGLTESQAYPMAGELDYAGLWSIAGLNRPELHDPPWQPVTPPALADANEDIFAALRQQDVLVHHPYESFDASVARFIRAAAADPRVQALKMTVYRIGSDTPFIDALIQAAEAGKQVACLVEVTARFDELQNLRWAEALDRVGVHVVYGMMGLKTHTKTALVVRQDPDGLCCYAHIGTGNYHVKTARLYTDLGLFTCDPVLTGDVVNLFHYLTGGARGRPYHKLLVAPVTMRQRFLEMIEREIAHHQAGRPAHIIAKMNQLEDAAMCEALDRASRAAVPIDLIVRGFCLLPPADNRRVMSIIGRFLEHSRVYYFQNGAADPLAGEFYIGSADWMKRNLSDRVEAVTPVEAPALRARLWQFLQIMLADERQAWDMRPDGTYVQRQPLSGATGPETLGTHQAMMALVSGSLVSR